jgi:hypothetical protein
MSDRRGWGADSHRLKSDEPSGISTTAATS